MKWRIYYGDGSTVDAGTPVEEAPTRDVQLIVQADPDVGWAMYHMRDYYVWIGESWLGVDNFGLWDYLARPGWKRVLFGRTLLRQEFASIYERAKAARDFAKKNGFLPSEQHEEME